MASVAPDPRTFDSESCNPPVKSAMEVCAPHDHICLIYETQEEQFEAVVPFLSIGLERGEKCLYIVDENTPEAILEALRAEGVDVDAAVESGALKIVSSGEAYLKNGDFDPASMMSYLQQAVENAEAEGYTSFRVSGETSWVLRHRQSLDSLIDYECRINNFFPRHKVLALCQYNRRCFPPETLLKVLRTHSFVAWGDMLCENPHYIPPEAFDSQNYDPASEVDRLLNSIIQNAQLKKDLAAEAEQANHLSVETARWRQLYEAVLANTPDFGYLFDLNHRFTYANDAVLKMWGRTWDEAIGKTCLELGYEPWHAAMHDREIEEVIATRMPIRGEVPFTGANGHRIYDYIFFPVLGPTGEVEAVGGTTRDITQRKEAEEALRESEKRLAAELADMQELHKISLEIGYDDETDGLHKKLVEAAVAIMRSDFASMQMLYPERGDGGELLLLAQHGFDPQAVKFWKWVRANSNCSCGAALRTQKQVVVPDTEQCEFMAGTADLDAYRAAGIRSMQTTLLVSRGGKLLGMISTHWREPHQPSERDLRTMDILARQAADLLDRKMAIERQRQSEAALRKSEKFAAAGRMAATIAHEINNPLEAIMNLSYLLGQEDLSPMGRELIKALDSELNRVSHIAKQTLGFYRDSKTAGPVDIVEPVNAAVLLFTRKAELGGANIETDFRASESLFGFSGELRQVFANLIGNALESGATTIKIRTSSGRDPANRHRTGVRVTVSDNGSGIPAESAAKLFEPFFTTKEEKGTGLGLWVSKGIVQKHDGWIRARSCTRPGRSGTSFCLFLPALKDDFSMPGQVD